MGPRHPNCRSTIKLYRESPRAHLRRLTIQAALTPWYRPMLKRKRQKRLKLILSIYRPLGGKR